MNDYKKILIATLVSSVMSSYAHAEDVVMEEAVESTETETETETSETSETSEPEYSELAADSGQWKWNVTLSTLSLKSSVLNNPVTSTLSLDAIELSMGMDYAVSNWLTSLGFGIQMLDDSGGFSVRVRDQYGKESTESSSATGVTLYAATGPKWQLGENNEHILFTQLGFASVVESSRDVGNCSNCPSQDLGLEGGAYIKGGYMFNLDSIALGLNYTQYVSSDSFDNSIGFIISSAY